MLWRAVLVQAIVDAAGGPIADASRMEADGQRAAARAWFQQGDRDFEFVALAADLDPDAVREAVLRKLGAAEPVKPPPDRS